MTRRQLRFGLLLDPNCADPPTRTPWTAPDPTDSGRVASGPIDRAGAVSGRIDRAGDASGPIDREWAASGRGDRAGDATRLIDIARDADRFGLDLLGVRDEPYRRGSVDMPTLLASVLAVTSRIRVLPAVACLPLRPPAALAKAIATMDRLSGGRAELGLGAGASPAGAEAYGGGRPAMAALEEAVQVVRLHWSDQGGLTFAGEHYRFAAPQAGPAPDRRIPIWLGTDGPRGLDLTGRVADGWLARSSRVPPGRLADARRRIDAAAERVGRDPADIRRGYILEGTLDGRASGGFLHGPSRRWIDEMTELAIGHGIDTFLFAGAPERLAEFALEIVPAVREQAAREWTTAPAAG